MWTKCSGGCQDKWISNRSDIGGPTRDVRMVENEEIVLNTFEENPTRSQRAVSCQMTMSRSSLQRILKENSMHAYLHTRIQQLKPEDYPIRRMFCAWLLNQNNGNPNFLSRVAFTMRRCLVTTLFLLTEDFKKGFLSTCGPVFK
jgi:hypothetical protein